MSVKPGTSVSDARLSDGAERPGGMVSRRDALAMIGGTLLLGSRAQGFLAAPLGGGRRGKSGNRSSGNIEKRITGHLNTFMQKSASFPPTSSDPGTNTPGMAVAYYVKGSDGVVCRGIARPDTQASVDSRTVFGIGSVTKVFNGTLLAYRVNSQPGRFHLTDSVTRHLPPDVEKNKKPYSWIDEVQLVNLATHTAFYDSQHGAWPQVYRDQPPSADLETFWETWPSPNQKPPPPKPGTKYQYSDACFTTLACAVAGTQYSSLLDTAITGPLSMKSTVAQNYLHQPYSRVFGNNENKQGDNVTVKTFNSDLNSTPDDMLKFLKAQLKVISMPAALSRSIDLAHQVHFQDATPQMDLGLAWQISKSSPTTFTKNGFTSTSGNSCWIGFIPDLQTGVVVLSNKNYGARPSWKGIDYIGGQILDDLAGLSASD